MTVTVRLAKRVIREPSKGADQSGVALLQVLLLSVLISLLAIRFTETARDQIEIAGQFDNRIRAQLTARSVISEVLFVLLSESFVELTPNGAGMGDLLINKEDINYHGAPIDWGQGVSVQIQDLNGLLPQIFPEHPLWERLLERWPLSRSEINRYLGVMKDIQDNDIRSWVFGDVEPEHLPTGQRYLNGYMQNSKPMEWIFKDRPELLALLLEVSDVHGTWSSNPNHYPDSLLKALVDPKMAEAMIFERYRPTIDMPSMIDVPTSLRGDYTTKSFSGRFKIKVDVELDGSAWTEERTIRLQSSSKPPYVRY